MMTFDPTWIALGGAVGLVGAFWGRVQSTASLVMNLIKAEVYVDSSLAPAVAAYLREEFTSFRVGSFQVKARMLRVKTAMGVRSLQVPFLLPSVDKNWFFQGLPFSKTRGKKFIWLSASTRGNELAIQYTRGRFSIEAIVNEALDRDENFRHKKRESRYQPIFERGSDKAGLGAGSYSAGGSTNRSSSLRGDDISSTASSSDVMSKINLSIDRSFRYPNPEVYLNGKDLNPFEGLFYGEEILYQVQEAENWLEMEDWYSDRLIPWRRGVLLHGPGGTGKSSFAKALAKKLDIPLVSFHLASMSDTEFLQAWRNQPVPCVSLFEDFDTVFKKRENLTAHKQLNFDTILDQLSGVDTLSGTFLVMTTNHIENIDEAIGVGTEDGLISSRPGRIDKVMYMGAATKDCRRSIITAILGDWAEEIEGMVEVTEGFVPAQVQEACTQRALILMRK